MPATSILPPFAQFTDRDGTPLDGGYIYIGSPGLDAQTNAIVAYWDDAFSIPAAQPIRTLGGYPLRSGSPARVYVPTDFSITVLDGDGTFVYSSLTGAFAGGGSGLSAFYADRYTTTAGQTTFTLTTNPASINALDVSLDGSSLVPGDDFTWTQTTLTLTAPAFAGQRLLARYTASAGTATVLAGSVTDVSVAAGSILYDSVLAVNVEHYGAVGDGVTDDTAAINAALANGHAFFPHEGPWMFNGILSITQNNTRIWSNCNAVLKILNTTPYLPPVVSPYPYTGYPIEITGRSGVLIENITLDCNVAYRSLAQSWTFAMGGICVTNGSNHCRLTHVTVRDCGIANPPGPSSGLSLGGGEGFNIKALETDSGDCFNNAIENCRVEDSDGQLSFGFRMWTDHTINQAPSAYLRKVRNNTLLSNTVIGTSWNAIEIAGCATVCNSIVGNVSYAALGPSGIESDKGASYNSFTGNIVQKRSWDGLTANDFAAFRDQGALGSGFPTRYATNNVWTNSVANDLVKGPSVSSIGMIIDYSKNATISNLSFSGYTDAGYVSNSSRGVQMFDASGITVSGLNVDLSACTGTTFGLLLNQNCADISVSDFRIVLPASGDGVVMNSGVVAGLRLNDGEIVSGLWGLRTVFSGTTITKGYITNVTFYNQGISCINMSSVGTYYSGIISGCKFFPAGGGAVPFDILDWGNIFLDNSNAWTGTASSLPLTIASAATLTLPRVLNTFKISGTTGITSISAVGWTGQIVNLIFTGALTVTDGSNLKLSSNFTTTADDVLTLSCDGTNWYEVARSAN